MSGLLDFQLTGWSLPYPELRLNREYATAEVLMIAGDDAIELMEGRAGELDTESRSRTTLVSMRTFMARLTDIFGSDSLCIRLAVHHR